MYTNLYEEIESLKKQQKTAKGIQDQILEGATLIMYGVTTSAVMSSDGTEVWVCIGRDEIYRGNRFDSALLAFCAGVIVSRCNDYPMSELDTVRLKDIKKLIDRTDKGFNELFWSQ
ncbi:MAG: hypothetical protein GY928_33820 [Colwellia sp.]|nr:hypothetical protein [Colwellia sp.]